MVSTENLHLPSDTCLPAFCILTVSRSHNHDSMTSPGQGFWQGPHHIPQPACTSRDKDKCGDGNNDSLPCRPGQGSGYASFGGTAQNQRLEFCINALLRMLSHHVVSCLSGSLRAAAHLTANCTHAVELPGNDARSCSLWHGLSSSKTRHSVCLSALVAVVT